MENLHRRVSTNTDTTPTGGGACFGDVDEEEEEEATTIAASSANWHHKRRSSRRSSASTACSSISPMVLNNPMARSVNALTQQDIVEWDESDNVDLRATTTPPPPPNGGTAAGASTGGGMTVTFPSAAGAGDAVSTAATDAKRPAAAGRRGSFDPEEEVDRLFSRLEGDDEERDADRTFAAAGAAHSAGGSAPSPTRQPSSIASTFAGLGGVLRDRKRRRKQERQQQQERQEKASPTNAKENGLLGSNAGAAGAGGGDKDRQQPQRPVSRRTRRQRSNNSNSNASKKESPATAAAGDASATDRPHTFDGAAAAAANRCGSGRTESHLLEAGRRRQATDGGGGGANEFDDLLREIEGQKKQRPAAAVGEDSLLPGAGSSAASRALASDPVAATTTASYNAASASVDNRQEAAAAVVRNSVPKPPLPPPPSSSSSAAAPNRSRPASAATNHTSSNNVHTKEYRQLPTQHQPSTQKENNYSTKRKTSGDPNPPRNSSQAPAFNNNNSYSNININLANNNTYANRAPKPQQLQQQAIYPHRPREPPGNNKNNRGAAVAAATLTASNNNINNSNTAGSSNAFEPPVAGGGGGGEVDEFGDLDLSMEDLAKIDALMEQATQREDHHVNRKEPPPVQQQQQQDQNHTINAKSQPPAPHPSAQQQPHRPPPAAAPAAFPLTQAPTAVCTSLSSSADVAGDDFFDDFPDLDFDALDKSIEERQAKTTAVSNNSLAVATTAVPPADAPVRNPRTALPPSSEISYLSFSRYRVIRVDQDISTFTLTLSVAKWQPSMLEDVGGSNGDSSSLRSISKNMLARLLHESASEQQPAQRWPIDGVIHLRGEWYFTRVAELDDIHICSLAGEFRTDILPLMLHTNPPHGSDPDDLVLIVHPDMLLIPSGISDSTCTRRAVLKNRMGSTGFSNSAALFGTMRHGLFDETFKDKDFSAENARNHVRKIVRKNAENLVALQISSHDAETEVMKVLPQLQRFAKQYTNLDPSPGPRNHAWPTLELSGMQRTQVQFLATKADAVEEPAISHELGLRGSVDMVVEASTASSTLQGVTRDSALMSVELKTGHNQATHHAHTAQLALYIIMLQARFGRKRTFSASASAPRGDGVLLYMNNEAIKAVHVVPHISEIKSLIENRNTIAIETLRAARPRGILLSYQNEQDGSNNALKIDLEKEVTPVSLPDVLPNVHPCQKCYAKRECMVYAGAAARRSDDPRDASVVQTHKELLESFTGNLSDDDIAYFQKWDRLIDLEADAGYSNKAEAWLVPSAEREETTSKCISSLCFDPTTSSSDALFDDTAAATISFKRSSTSPLETPLQNLGFEGGCFVMVSTDSTSTSAGNETNINHSRPYMGIVRGIMERASGSTVTIRAKHDDLTRIRKFVSRLEANSAGQQAILFRLDRDELSTGVGTLRQNLINLFAGDVEDQTRNPNRLAWLRDVIVRTRTPSFDGTVSLFSPAAGHVPSIPGCDLEELAFEFSELNEDQRAAAQKVITAKDYSLIQGLPGTGKTSTIAFVARLLAAHGKRVLISSYTNAAVDNVLLKLIENGLATTDSSWPTPALIRVGRESSCHPGVNSVHALNAAKDFERKKAENLNQLSDTLKTEVQELPSPDSLHRVVSQARIVGATASTVPRSALLAREHFDVVIVDEAGQITQPAIIGALMTADTFVLLGDHMQLPPLVTSELADKGGYGVSLLKHLAEAQPDSVAKLTYQYRMNAEICQISNDMIYGGLMKCANESVSARCLDLPGFPENVPESISTIVPSNAWLKQAVDPSNPVVFVNTDADGVDSASRPVFQSLERRLGGHGSGGSLVNDSEAALVRIVVGSLISCGLAKSDVGVICPFRSQASLIDGCPSIQSWKSDGLEVSTIDKYQGRDKDAIVVSFVRSNSGGKVGRLMEDVRRLNVALTRAKCKLIMIGSFSTLHTGSSALRTSLNRMKKQGRVLQVRKEAPQQNTTNSIF